MRKALEIGTVIVDHEVLLDPAEAATAKGVQFGSGGGAGEGRPGFSAVCGGASGGVKVAVIGCKWSFRPVGFDQSASGCPIVRVPKAGVDSHRLSPRKRYADLLRILELSNRIVVY